MARETPGYHVHFTPTSASWLNLVERWFVELTEKQIRRGIHRSTRELIDAIKRYLVVTNETAKPFVWTKSADEILASVARFCERTSNSGHSHEGHEEFEGPHSLAVWAFFVWGRCPGVTSGETTRAET